MQVARRPLDALGLSPTFIKLHLEGAELAALTGARGHFSRTGRSSPPPSITTLTASGERRFG